MEMSLFEPSVCGVQSLLYSRGFSKGDKYGNGGEIVTRH